MFPFAFWSRGWRSGNNYCHNLSISHLKKTALPPINNFAPQQKIDTMVQRPTYAPSGDASN